MIGLFDRDVFLKLGCCDLWHEALAALGVTQAYRLESMSSERSNTRIVKRILGEVGPEDTLARVSIMVAEVPVLAEGLLDGLEDSQEYALLNGVEDIDAGEQLLGAILLRNPATQILVSGDKRFVRAFRNHLPDRWNAVSESVISFEMCLLAIEGSYGFDFLLQRVHPVKHCDGSLMLALGHEPSAESFREALASFNPCRAAA
ncbi:MULTISPECIES: hypothetical protein [Rhizobium]|uniref:hypothetical protein n=1 Tax=Rhizobium TaxID=379 RepID=UPI0010315EC2|nr:MULTISPECIES: hypothetical protein [Rhizobium]MBY5483244.1 hypothetical protein [Rhizobium leguminosarum]NEI28464.1 hypothetical protein [Rhizobium ruizarguesonis]TBA81182.1 hypothetical protein ELH56_13510 [Rhizobium ruizarguesonis]TBZ64520.1 hypothetical protein E0H43_32880 [Rhizobium leguminosarum bv. viciae]